MGLSRCENPTRVDQPAVCGLPQWADRSKPKPIETLGRRGTRLRARVESVRAETGRNPGQGFGRSALEGQNPREQPVAGVLTPRWLPGTPARVEAQEPRPAGPARCFGSGINGRENGMWVLPGGNAPDTLREEEAPKGESQERRRCEIEPARARKEKTATRVIKP